MVTEVDYGSHFIVFTLSAATFCIPDSSSVKNLTPDSLFTETKQNKE